MQLRRTPHRQVCLLELGAGLLHVRRVFERRQRLARCGEAIACERLVQRGALFLGAESQLLRIQLDERLAGTHGIPEIGEDPHHASVYFGGNRDLVRGGECTGDFEMSCDVLARHDLDRDLARLSIRPGALSS